MFITPMPSCTRYSSIYEKLMKDRIINRPSEHGSWLMCSINLNRSGGLNTRNLAQKLRPAAVLSLNLYVNALILVLLLRDVVLALKQPPGRPPGVVV
jgi:hypothetical protein